MSFLRAMICTAVCLGASMIFGAAARAGDKPFTIGAILPLSGPSAAWGEYAKNGLELALSQLAEKERRLVRIVYEDDSWQPARSVAAFQKLVNSGRINALIALGSAVGNALGPLSERQQIPFIAIGASDFNVVKGREFVFSHWVMPEIEAKKLAAEIKKRGYPRLGIIASEHEGLIALYNAVKEAFKAEGLLEKVVLDERFLPGETDFRTFVAKAKQKDLEAVVVLIMPEGAAAFAKQARQSGLKAALPAIEVYEDESVIEASGGALLGQWFVTLGGGSQEFEKAYRAKFPSAPGWTAAPGYDSFNLLYQAGVKRGLGGKELAKYLHAVSDYQGACGTYSASGDGRFSLPAEVKVVTESGFVKLSKIAQKIKLGAIASLTGPAGEQGQNWLNGALLAVDELKAEGADIELIVEEDGTNPAKVVSAFHKFAKIDKVQAIIGGTWDYLAEAAYPLARQHRLPFITPTNPVEILSQAATDNPFVFTNGLSLAAEKKAAGDFLDKFPVKTAALIYPNVPFGTSHAEMLDELIKERGLRVVYRYEFPMEGYQEAIRLGALKIAQTKPDLVFIVSFYALLDLFCTELKKLKANPLILATQHLDEAFLMSNEPEKYKRAFGIYPKAVLDQDFIQRYQKKFSAPPKVYAAEGYDAAMFLARALNLGVKLDSSEARFVYEGVSGRHELPARGRALAENQAVIMTTQNGVFELFK